MQIAIVRAMLLAGACMALCRCGPLAGGNLGGPTMEERVAAIAAEPEGDHYIGRRYYVQKTRFWGYLREPRQPWSKARLVMMRESRVAVPDRLPEEGPSGARYGFDQNHEYRIRGRYTGREVYDPNSNQFLPEFEPEGFELIASDPGWIFRPDDRYDSRRITLWPR